ncbi:hypothetical protein HY310_03170, partial [Candidatus Microgenomates bacterium]|nr:hypothetical protein [Candidatus Microgenomates bacterium]
MKIVFFGTSQYCLPVLEALKDKLVLVVTRVDKPMGRKQTLTPSTTKQWAIANNVPVSAELNIGCDLAIVADFGRIIPASEFNIPKLGTFNIHFSKLPDLRGATPVQQTLLRGDKTAWVTIFKIEEKLDTGPILDQREFSIFPNDTAGSLYTRLFEEVANYLPTLDFTKPLTPQTGTPTFCKKLTKDDGFIDWKEMLNDKYQMINYRKYQAFSPWPGIWTI